MLGWSYDWLKATHKREAEFFGKLGFYSITQICIDQSPEIEATSASTAWAGFLLVRMLQ